MPLIMPAQPLLGLLLRVAEERALKALQRVVPRAAGRDALEKQIGRNPPSLVRHGIEPGPAAPDGRAVDARRILPRLHGFMKKEGTGSDVPVEILPVPRVAVTMPDDGFREDRKRLISLQHERELTPGMGLVAERA
jgi:hypothetical protein